MKHFFNINNWQLLKSIYKRIRGLRCIFLFCFCHSFSLSQQLKIFESRNQPQEKKWTHEILTRKNFRPTKYPQEKISDPRIPTRKFWTHEIPTRKNFGPMNTHEKNSGPTKFPREKNLDPRNTHEKKFWTHEIPNNARWRDGTKLTIARDRRNLAHSAKS